MIYTIEYTLLLRIFTPSSFKLTDIFPTEAASSSRTVRVQVPVSEVTLLVEPQTPLVIIHYLFPVGTFSSLSLNHYISDTRYPPYIISTGYS